MSVTSGGAPKLVVCLSNQTADETLGPWIDVQGYTNHTFYVTGVGTVSSGVVSFEEASPIIDAMNAPVVGEATGGYSVIQTCTAADVTGGAQKAYHSPPNATYHSIRARISTAIGGGGNVSVTLVAS